MFKPLLRPARSHREPAAPLPGVVHELKTPLATIRGYVDLLMRQEREPLAREYLQNILEGVQREEHLVDSLLDHDNLGNWLVVEPSAVDLMPYVYRALEDFSARHPGRAVEADLPPAMPTTADAERIVEVLENLLENAALYSFLDAPITIGVRVQAGEYVVDVSDSGPAIPAHELGKIFRPLVRGSTACHDGHGLGLAISDAIVRAHHGRLWATSSPMGNRFAFTLPVRKEA